MLSPLRKRVTIAVVGATALGLGVASAATLSGLSSSSLGANDTVVSSCDNDGVSIAYTNTYDGATGKYRTTAVTIGGMAPACVNSGKTVSVTLRDASGAIGSGSATVTAASQVIALTPSPAAEAVLGAAVVIAG